MVCELHVKARNQLGEGATWDPGTQALLWVDIPRRRVFCMSVDDPPVHEVAMPEEPGCLARLECGGYLVAAGRSLFRLDTEGPHIERLSAVAGMDPASALNDGKPDRQGRFLFGSKHIEENDAKGAMFAFETGAIRHIRAPFTVFNGPAFNRAGDRIYFADTPTGRIFTAAYDPASGDMRPPEVFVQVPTADGFPDGMTVDAEGHLWNAHWDGGRLTRYRPDGSMECVVEVPVRRPKSLCFGGPDLQTIFVTSAAVGSQAGGSGDGEIDDGDLLRLNLGITGLPETPVRLGSI